jgi:hypothetical protein
VKKLAKKQKVNRRAMAKKRRLLLFIQLTEIVVSISVAFIVAMILFTKIKRQQFQIGSEVFVPPLVLSALFFLAWKLNAVWEKIFFGEEEKT